jgi:L-ascorbate metabolism protein UlaG (beta-lactamase superfamily)
MLENIHWLGHDSFRLDGSVTVYVDPWKLPPGQPQAGVVLVTHDHYDHLSLPDIQLVAGPGTVVVGPECVTGQVKDLRTVTLAPDESAEVGGVTVEAVAAYNLDKFRAPGQPFHPREAGYVGYVFALDGVRYYHAGDTDAIPEMKDVRCDIAFLPVSGTYVMTCDEACHACDMVAAQHVVPMHYGDIVGSDDDAERFRAGCRVPVTILPLERG